MGGTFFFFAFFFLLKKFYFRGSQVRFGPEDLFGFIFFFFNFFFWRIFFSFPQRPGKWRVIDGDVVYRWPLLGFILFFYWVFYSVAVDSKSDGKYFRFFISRNFRFDILMFYVILNRLGCGGRFLPSFTGFYLVSAGWNDQPRISPSMTRFYWVFLPSFWVNGFKFGPG